MHQCFVGVYCGLEKSPGSTREGFEGEAVKTKLRRPQLLVVGNRKKEKNKSHGTIGNRRLTYHGELCIQNKTFRKVKDLDISNQRKETDIIPIRRIRLVDEATRLIREMILNGKLSPGVRLRQADLANQLGISRTPLRESLMKLEQEGLIGRLPRGGLTVVELEFAEAIELYEIREMLDGLAAALTARREDEKSLGIIRGHLKRMEKCRAKAEQS